MFLKINGRVHYLWRAVDQDGDVLDILVQSYRNKKAAKKFFRKLESLYFQFLNYNVKDFPRAALGMIEHFQPSKGGPLWMKHICEEINKL